MLTITCVSQLGVGFSESYCILKNTVLNSESRSRQASRRSASVCQSRVECYPWALLRSLISGVGIATIGVVTLGVGLPLSCRMEFRCFSLIKN
jgi:hypothetical protein